MIRRNELKALMNLHKYQRIYWHQYIRLKNIRTIHIIRKTRLIKLLKDKVDKITNMIEKIQAKRLTVMFHHRAKLDRLEEKDDLKRRKNNRKI